MKRNIIRIMMVVSLAIAFPISSWAIGTPTGFTVDLSGANGTPVSGNSLRQQMNNAAINLSTTNPLTGATTVQTLVFSLLWEFSYIDANMHIVGSASNASTCAITRTINVTDSRSGLPLAGASVSMAGSTQVTGATGSVTFTNVSVSSLAGASVNVRVTAPNHTPGTATIAIVCGSTGTTAVPLLSTAVAAAGNVTIVLTWGRNPKDLDSHLTGPKTTGALPRFHTWYAGRNRAGIAPNLTAANATIPALLDIDDITSFGPETTTILRPGGTFVNGVYRFSVRHFSGTATLETSGATVKVFQGATLLATFRPPVGQAARTRLWTVCEIRIVGGAVSVVGVNTYSNLGFAASVAGSGSTAVTTPLGVVVHSEDPAIFAGAPTIK